MKKKESSQTILKLLLHIVGAIALLWGLHYGPGGLAPIGNLLDPARGLYHNARITEYDTSNEVIIPGLVDSVIIERDERGVPHIFADTDQDAVVALGYITAQDRLFQMDFMSRVTAGRLSEIFGPNSINTDKYLRSTGMSWAAKRIEEAHIAENSLDYKLLGWFADGANAYIDNLSYAEWPFEFKLFGYAPDRRTPLHSLLLVQYFNFDLGFESDDAAYGIAQERFSLEEYDELYPRYASRFIPVIPSETSISKKSSPASERISLASSDGLALLRHMHNTLRDHGIEGFQPSKGSNNWGVTGHRSVTGASIIAGDMHLSISLPSIWYEVHIVTPSMNTYGVASPGTPVPVMAFNDHVSWAHTNSEIDVIDHYLLELSNDGLQYKFDGEWLPLEMHLDTIHVKGSKSMIDTLTLSHLGPVVKDSSVAFAIKWIAQEKGHVMSTLWKMNHAENASQMDSLLHHWHSPSQNILYADANGNIGMRTAGVIPIRASGHGIGFVDGSTSETAWIGTIPAEEMPSSQNPDQGYLTATNQQPTTEDYPYYLNHDWTPAYRSLRIDALLSGKDQHSIEDLMDYQGDVYVGQYDAFVPLLDSVQSLTPQGEQIRRILKEWNGFAEGEAIGPLVLYEYLNTLKHLTWDEPEFQGLPQPSEVVLVTFLEQGSVWLDIQETPEIEDALMLMQIALEKSANSLQDRYGDDWSWDSNHKITFRHLTGADALDALWRGPYSYPGYYETLAPGDGLDVSLSASWRGGVDFSTPIPQGFGIYAGGQSGNPLSSFYDLHIQDYVNYDYYSLHNPRKPGNLDAISSRLILKRK